MVPKLIRAVSEFLVWGFLLSGALPQLASAQTDQMAFHNIYQHHTGKGQWLSGINHIVQDQHGFIWFGGENGLARYDGQNTRVYRHDPDDPHSLVHGFIRDLLVDAEGRLWVATESGLCRYVARLDRFACGRDYGQVILPEGGTRALARDVNDDLYLGTDSGLYRLAADGAKIVPVALAPPAGKPDAVNQIVSIALDTDRSLWLGTNGSGLIHFDPDSGRTHHFLADSNNPHSLAHNKVQALTLDGRGRLWVATYGGGVSVLNVERTHFENHHYQEGKPGTLSSNIVWNVFKDSYNTIWLAVDQGGLVRFDEERGFIAMRHKPYDPTSLVADQVRTVFEDSNEDLWIGTFPFGVSFYNRSTEHIENFKNEPGVASSLSHDAILSIHRDTDDNIWIGTEDGLNLFNPENKTFLRYQFGPNTALTARAVLSIEQYDRNTLWIGTWSGGLMAFDLRDRSFSPIHTAPADGSAPNSLFIWDIMRDSNGDMWLASEFNGVNHYSRDTGEFTYYTHEPGNDNSLWTDFVWSVLEDRRGAIWMATIAGLSVLHPGEAQPRRVHSDPGNPQALQSIRLITLYEDARGRVWIGSEDNGAFIFDPATGDYRHLGVAHGLPSSTVSAFRADAAGNIWALTTNGLVKIDPDDFSLKVLGAENGLVGSNFNRNAVLAGEDGRMYFGGFYGMSVFDPADHAAEVLDFPVWVTNLRIMNKEVAIGEPGSPLDQHITFARSIKLDHRDVMFAFDFAALNYRNYSDTRYAYTLEGFDHGWNYIGRRKTATYTNIAPGEYTFRVKASSGDNQWRESPSLRIVKEPAPWQSSWAYAGYALSLALLGYLLVHHLKLRLRTNMYRTLSVTDTLTGVANRSGLTTAAESLFCAGSEQGLCVIFMDIDHFKSINDQYGHDSGDKVLVEVAQVFRRCIRQDDAVGRWGGEEFILLCAGMDKVAGLRRAEDIREQVAQHVFDRAKLPIKVTLSLGVALVKPQESFETACKRADEALYKAKSSGRNRVVFADW